MDIKDVLGHLFNGIIVNKDEKNDYSKKINFDSLSQIFLKTAESKKDLDENAKKGIDLGGNISIYIKKYNTIKVIRCNEDTPMYQIAQKINPNDHSAKFCFKDKAIEAFSIITLREYGIKNGDRLVYNNTAIGGGDEFYIEDDFLDPAYDYDFRGINDGEQKFFRGGLEYKRPCGWKRYALKVKGKYENDLWLGDTGKSNNDSEWAVAYHGTKQKFVDPILKTGLRPGNRNFYGVGVYCTPNINTAANNDYATEFFGNDGKKYRVVLQTRVKPSAIKKASDNGGPADYWYIEDGKNIRPYSICVKEVS